MLFNWKFNKIIKKLKIIQLWHKNFKIQKLKEDINEKYENINFIKNAHYIYIKEFIKKD